MQHPEPRPRTKLRSRKCPQQVTTGTERKGLPPSPSTSNEHRRANARRVGEQRKRLQEDEEEEEEEEDISKPNRKRQRHQDSEFLAHTTENGEEAVINRDPVRHWIHRGKWPQQYFEPNIAMSWPLARKRSSASLRRSTTEPSSQNTEDTKSAPYRSSAYATLLAEKGNSFLKGFQEGPTEQDKARCQALLRQKQGVPRDSLFRDDVFGEACYKLLDQNEARVVDDIARLIVPSAETLATFGSKELEKLIVGLNECWTESIPVTSTPPKPDFCVGFRRSAFTADQLRKLKPFTGDVLAAKRLTSFFLATWRMYFPFFTSEVKCGVVGLDIADRQNAHSMTLAVRGIVELFRAVKRERELHRRILAFSISHDHKAVRIYGHYPVIDGGQTAFYCHCIDNFDFTMDNGQRRWTAYQFTENVYKTWVPDHHRLICSAIDDIPDNLSFDVSIGDSFTSAGAADDFGLADSQQQETEPSAPSSQNTGFKKPRLPTKAIIQKENERLREDLVQEREQRERDSEKQRQAFERLEERNNRLEEQIRERDSEKQRQAFERLEERNNRLEEQIRELMDALKGRQA